MLTLQGLQQARLITLTKLQIEAQNATPTSQGGFILSDDGISFIKDLEKLVTYIEEGVGFLCAINERLGLPALHLQNQFKDLIQSDRKFIAKLGVRRA